MAERPACPVECDNVPAACWRHFSLAHWCRLDAGLAWTAVAPRDRGQIERYVIVSIYVIQSVFPCVCEGASALLFRGKECFIAPGMENMMMKIRKDGMDLSDCLRLFCCKNNLK